MSIWSPNRKVGDKRANSHEGAHEALGFSVAWKRGPKGEGWFYGSPFSWKGPYATSQAAYDACVSPPQPFGRHLKTAAA